MALITFLSLIPITKEIGSSIPLNRMDKVIHGLFYLILTYLVFRSYRRHHKKQSVPKRTSFILVLSIISYGICIEFAQEAFFLGRHFEILDIIANIIGTLSGYLLINYLIKDKL